MYEPRSRKLAAMGVASLVSTGRAEILERLPTEIFNLWTDVFAELKEEQSRREEGDGPGIELYWDQPTSSFYKGTEDTQEYNRRKTTFDNDIVRTTLLTSYIAQSLQRAETTCGFQFMQDVLAKADPNVLRSIQIDVFGRP